MQIQDLVRQLEILAPPGYQESYDNAGLLTGNASVDCTGALCTLDCTEEVVQEAIDRRCNLVVAHHPILFTALKKLNGKDYVERALILAIKNDIAIYAIHTNLDNVMQGVNDRIADKLGLVERSILVPQTGLLAKLSTYVPVGHADAVREALFAAGAGKVGKYEECSFQVAGTGTFKPMEGAQPFSGEVGSRETGSEIRLELLFPLAIKARVLKALFVTHPYETVAYEIVKLENTHQEVGSGMIGRLPGAIEETIFLDQVKAAFGVQAIRHTRFLHRPVRTVAVCGGAGSFLTKAAMGAGADAYITADIKYHEFFDADGKILLADIGHWESEQFTTELLAEFLQEKFPTFAVLKTDVSTNPVRFHV